MRDEDVLVPVDRADVAVIRELLAHAQDLLTMIQDRYGPAVERLADHDVQGAADLGWELRATAMSWRQSEVDLNRGTLASVIAAAGRVLGSSATMNPARRPRRGDWDGGGRGAGPRT